jgi:hypothetical protein
MRAFGIVESVVIRNNDCAEIVSTALAVVPLYVAEIVTVPDTPGLIDALTEPCELNPATVTLAGTVASAVLLLDSVTTAPPAGVNAVKRTVTVVLAVPVCTVAGSRNTESTNAGGCGGGGVSVSVTDRVTPLYVPDTTADMVVVTCTVEMKNGQLLTPAGTVIVAGTEMIEGLLLDNATTAPPGGATAERIDVPPTVVPPCTLGDVTVTESIVTDVGGAVVVVVVGAAAVVVVAAGGVAGVQPDRARTVAGPVPSLMSTVQSAGRV